MKDSFKEFIEKNRDAFDAQTPPESTWHKIETSLPRAGKQIFINSLAFWRAAAIVLLGISSYLFFTKNDMGTAKKDVTALQGFSDLESYYSLQIKEKMTLVHRFQSQTDITEDDVTQNLKKLEAMYLVLRQEMKNRPTQDVRDALVLNLLVRIDLINQQLNKLDRPQKEDQTRI
ncbi:MAG TPA: hypothetical protein VL728_08900 [Cyclobacteriaceae bacterium]|jgi:hypothetical protein|nr:hypothetical protein [Cyclobacteriaceae bacterium]